MPCYEVTMLDAHKQPLDDYRKVIDAATADKAKYGYALTVSDFSNEPVGEVFKYLRCRRLDSKPVDPEERAVARWNDSHGVGTPVRYWTGVREGTGQRARTRSTARMMCGTGVVWVEGHGACISLSHVEVAS